MDYKQIMLNNAKLHIFKTKKFKKMEIDVRFIDDIKEDNLSIRSLLASVLEAKTTTYPTKMEHLGKALESLYGANYNVFSSKRGTKSVITFSMQIVNPLYVKDNELMVNAFKYINDSITNPIFDKKTIDEEKRLLIEDIDGIIDDKGRYASKRFHELMFPNEITGLSNLGDKKYVKKINKEFLEDYYKNVFLNNSVEIIIVGDVNDDVIELSKKYLDFGSYTKTNCIDRVEKKIENVNDVVENIKSKQSHLFIGYRTNSRCDEAIIFPFAIMNSILGGASNSLLFTNVREKASLCYSIGSAMVGVKGYLYIRAGIDSEKYDEAKELIFKQVEDIKNGNFSFELLENSKKAFINDIKEDSDSIVGIARQIFFDSTLQREFDLYYGLEEIKNVTKEDIIKCANMLTLDTIYFLRGE